MALLKGWLRAGRRGADIVVVDPLPGDQLTSLAGTTAIRLFDCLGKAPKADTIVLAVKPQIAPDLFSSVAASVDEKTVVISIMAGISLAALRQNLATAGAIVRAMPNLSASVGRGVTVGIAEATTSDLFRAGARSCLKPLGPSSGSPTRITWIL